MSISQNLSSTRPTLNLNFARSKTLDPRITFTRSGSATYIDKNGSLKTVATNIPRFGYNTATGESLGLLLESSKTNICNYSNYIKFLNNKDGTPTIVSENTDLAPDGTMTATRIILSPVNYYTGKSYNISFNNTVKCLSIFAKNPLSGTNCLAIEGSGIIVINFNGPSITSVTIGSSSQRFSYEILSDNWYRFTFIEDGTSNNRFNIMGWFNGINKPILLWGAMGEYSPYPTSHIPTPAVFTSRSTSATFYDSTGILRTAAINVARSDAYFPDSSGVFRSAGLLLESAGTNLLYYSQDFDVASWWGATGANVLKAPQTLAPDGTYTADFLLEDTSTGNHSLLTTNNVYSVVSEYYTHSVYVKSAGRTQIGIAYRDSGLTIFDLTTKQITISQQIANGSIVANNIDTLPNGWFRLSSTILGNGGNYNRRAQLFLCSGGTASYAGNGSSGAYIWGYQVEQRSYATSYVPTPAGFSARASTATYFTSTGSLITAAVNELRNNAHFPDNSGVYRNVGNLLEQEATNLTTSSVFSTNGWNKQGSGNFTTAADPIGSTQATLVTPLITTAYNGFQNTVNIAGGTYVVSFYAKANGYNWVGIKCPSGNPWFYTSAGYNLSTLASFTYIQGGQTDFIFTPLNIQNAGNGWYRVSFKVVASGGFGGQLQILVYSDMPNQHAGSWTPNGTSGAFFWGVQIESSPMATSYIPTTVSQVTRSADILTTQLTATRAADVSSGPTATRSADSATITGSNFSSWYNSSGGTLLSLREGNSSVLTTSSLTLNSSFTKTSTISNVLYYPTALSYSAIERMNGSVSLVSSNLALNLDVGVVSSYSGVGTTWTDLTGNNNNGTLTNGPTYGSTNQGFIRLDGVNDLIDFGNNTTLYNAYDTSFTQEFAVRMLSNASTFKTLFRVDDWSRITTEISIIGIKFIIGYSTPSDILVYSNTLDYNQWYLITTVWSKLNTQKIYINGILVAQTTPIVSSYTGISGSTGGANIGRGHSDPFASNLNADIAFFRHYTRVLTDSEIRQNYNATKYRFAA